MSIGSLVRRARLEEVDAGMSFFAPLAGRLAVVARNLRQTSEPSLRSRKRARSLAQDSDTEMTVRFGLLWLGSQQLRREDHKPKAGE
jgi:hypothetical protein